MRPDEVGRAAFALCSGLFDGVSGQTIMVDRGSTFFDGISYIYERRNELGLTS
jgi:enoyl-[acyl-carrier-protein] reductase (NADH)